MRKNVVDAGVIIAYIDRDDDAHDWAISAEFVKASRLPVFLAGGLTPANVGNAIRQVRPFGVDLSSGGRTAGWLDPDKLAAFVSSVPMLRLTSSVASKSP